MSDLDDAMKIAGARAAIWFPDVWTGKGERSIASQIGLELGSEAGEVLDVIKRYGRVDGARAMAYRRGPMLADLHGECADVLMNVASLQRLFDLDLTGALLHGIAYNDTRFPAR
jgi:NTP pyrophosphatase (non-canonical NTP hydrolase)